MRYNAGNRQNINNFWPGFSRYRPALNFCRQDTLYRKTSRRYLCAKEKFHILLSFNYIHISQHYPVFAILAMVPPLNLRLRRFQKRITQIIVLVSVLWFLVSDAYAQTPKYIRVAIMQDAAFLRLKISGFYEVFAAQSQKVLYRGRNLNTTVAADKGGILLGNIKAKGNRLLIKSGDPNAIIIDGRMFRGNIQLIKKDSGLLVVNHIELEDYIKGILYHEASHYWPQDALKAQAIVCRTYAVYQMQENKLKDYDVTSDIYSQVYGGRTSERYRTNRVVQETQGIILTYQDKVFPAYYHATCGGHTEEAVMLWNINIAPLKGVVCNFCKESPHYRWHYVASANEIKDKFVSAGYKIESVKDIVILGRDASGRIGELKIITSRKEIKISGKDFRAIIGPNIIRSANFKVNLVSSDFVFEGLGWGHGVGLCQWGAYFMAKQGYHFKAILQYYYPEAEIETFKF